MKPLIIEFQAFGPYAGYEKVDFEAISSKGLFLICGKTGIGKTMILDAMTFALYGKSSGHLRDEFGGLRCTKAPYDRATFVKFTFENNGEYYIFERRLERRRKNLSPEYNAMKMDESGEYVPLFENAKEKDLNEKAAQIIGLEYDQFRQVIVLPQGQFEKLLTSDSSEKEKILTSIFGEEMWDRIAESIYQEASSRKDSLKSQKDRIMTSLADENCGNMTDLSELISGQESQLTKMDEAFNNEAYDEKSEQLQTELTLVNRFEDLDKAVRKKDELTRKRPEMDTLSKSIEGALRAEKVRGLIEEVDKAEDEHIKRQKEEEIAIKNAQVSETEYRKAVEEFDAHILGETENEEKKALKFRYEEKKGIYEEIDKVRKECFEVREKEKEAIRKEKEASQRVEDFAAKINEANDTYENLKSEHDETMSAYLHGITGVLAEKLSDGDPCPVCGSTSHPHKAPISACGVSKEKVDEAKESMDRAYERLHNLIDEREKAKNVLDEYHGETEKVHGKVVETATVLEGMTVNLVEGIENLESLSAEIARLGKEVEKYTSEKNTLETARKDKLGEFTAASAKVEPAGKETAAAAGKLKEARDFAERAVKENGFASFEEVKKLLVGADEIENGRKILADYEAAVKTAAQSVSEIEKELEGLKRPDKEALKNSLDEITAARSEYARRKGILTNEITRLKDKKRRLEREGFGIEEAIRQADEDFAFAKKLRGDTGTGLSRYVLGIMFSSVVSAANKMLEMVHGGRYRLYRSDDKVKGSHKSGLELKVFDRQSAEHEGRFVSTLSGGEKFLASLALSIGMSTIAGSAGIKIEALFIDEGFGSLDDDSIADAMEVLNSISEANGLVGIISHVALLQEQIPTKLMVTEDDTGSHIMQTVG